MDNKGIHQLVVKIFLLLLTFLMSDYIYYIDYDVFKN
jgi:hypothetical protein